MEGNSRENEATESPPFPEPVGENPLPKPKPQAESGRIRIMRNPILIKNRFIFLFYTPLVIIGSTRGDESKRDSARNGSNSAKGSTRNLKGEG